MLFNSLFVSFPNKGNKILIEIAFVYNSSDLNYDHIIRQLNESGVSVIVLVFYAAEATSFFTAVSKHGVLGTDKVMYIGKGFIYFSSVKHSFFILIVTDSIAGSVDTAFLAVAPARIIGLLPSEYYLYLFLIQLTLFRQIFRILV